MTIENKSLGQGTLIEAFIGAVWVKIGHILNYQTPGSDRPDVDVTDIDSPGFREYLLGFADGGTLSWPFLFNAADPGQVALEGLRGSNTPTQFRMTLANAQETEITFNGLVKNFRVEGGVDAPNQGTLDMRVTGDPSWEFDTTS